MSSLIVRSILSTNMQIIFDTDNNLLPKEIDGGTSDAIVSAPHVYSFLANAPVPAYSPYQMTPWLHTYENCFYTCVNHRRRPSEIYIREKGHNSQNICNPFLIHPVHLPFKLIASPLQSRRCWCPWWHEFTNFIHQRQCCSQPEACALWLVRVRLLFHEMPLPTSKFACRYSRIFCIYPTTPTTKLHPLQPHSWSLNLSLSRGYDADAMLSAT